MSKITPAEASVIYCMAHGICRHYFNINYRPRTEYDGKVMFWHVSVCLSTGGGGQSADSARGGVSQRGGGGQVQPGWGGQPARGGVSLYGGRYASCVHAGGLSCLPHVLKYIIIIEPNIERADGVINFLYYLYKNTLWKRCWEMKFTPRIRFEREKSARSIHSVQDFPGNLV